jgi:hypothetical protein
MNPQIAQRIAQFLTRVTLTPPEIPDYNVCMQSLQVLMQPTEVPKQENEDGLTNNADPDAGAG